MVKFTHPHMELVHPVLPVECGQEVKVMCSQGYRLHVSNRAIISPAGHVIPHYQGRAKCKKIKQKHT